MMAGALYIWIMLAFFVLTMGIVLALVVMMWVGHWMHRRETGAKHGFLELPEELRGSRAAAAKGNPGANGDDKLPSN